MFHREKRIIINKMGNEIVKHGQPNERGIKVSNRVIFDEFVIWSATPTPVRVKTGIETIEQFSEYHHIGRTTLWRWQSRPEYEARVRELRKKWGFEKTQGVIEGIYRSAVKGNSDSQRIWLQFFEGWSEKSTVENIKKVEVGVNDIRFLIEGMPEPTRTKFYGYLREIIDEAVALRNAGELADGLNEDDGIENSVSGEADHDAQDVPEQKEDGVARRHQGSVREDMVGILSSGNYQGPARWR